MRIEILGAGCPKCKSTEEVVRKALQELNLSAEVEHVYDVREIARRGVVLTPAVAVNGRVVLSGHVPTVDEMKQLLRS